MRIYVRTTPFPAVALARSRKKKREKGKVERQRREEDRVERNAILIACPFHRRAFGRHCLKSKEGTAVSPFFASPLSLSLCQERLRDR